MNESHRIAQWFCKVSPRLLPLIRHSSHGFVRHVRAEREPTMGGEDLNRKDSLSFSGCKLTQGQQPPVECGPRLSLSQVMGKKDVSFIPVSDALSPSRTDRADPGAPGPGLFSSLNLEPQRELPVCLTKPKINAFPC